METKDRVDVPRSSRYLAVSQVFPMEQGDVLALGKSCLQLEASELLMKASSLEKSFAEAVEAIWQQKGKLIVCGLGKSGHVARKISATFSSTGTPSFFLHPAEALHGDLGALTESDTLLAIAYGGETQETLEVVKYARRTGLKIIALTGKVQSNLARLASIVIDASIEQEACPLQLAPTCSTTVAMAIGDALAVTVMKVRGFKDRDFAQYHPGGSLGRRLSLVLDHMNDSPKTVKRDDPFESVLEMITSQNLGIVAVINDHHEPIGAITDGDLRRAIVSKREKVFQASAGDLMSHKPKIIRDDMLAVDAMSLMEKNNISSLFVVNEKGLLLGLVRMYDLLAAKII